MALIVIAVLINLYLIGKKSVHQELIIKASPLEIWTVLTDFDSIRSWNEVLIPLEGRLAEGQKVIYEFHQDTATVSKIPAMVKTVQPEQLLNQTGGMRWILTFDHKYVLIPDGDKTRLVIHEEYRGIAVPFWNPKPVEEAYGRLAESLRKRVLDLKN